MPAHKRILIVNPYGIGDVLFMTPLLKLLKSQSGVERLDVLLGSRTEVVLKNNPNIDQIYFLDKDELRELPLIKRLAKLLHFYSQLRKNRYDVFIDLSLTREYAFFAKFFLMIPTRIGFDYKGRGGFLNRKEALPFGFRDKKVPEYYLGLARFLDLSIPKTLQLDFAVSEIAKKNIREKLRGLGIKESDRVVCVSAGGGESWGKDASFKRWSPIFFKELLEKIRTIYPINNILFLGSAKDALLNEDVSRGLTIPFHHLAGSLDLEGSAACLGEADFALVNEGGICHLASTQKTPRIVLVGPVDEKVYGSCDPENELLIFKDDLACRPCYKVFRYKGDCEHRSCLKNLTPDEAFQKIVKSNFLKKL